MAMTKIMIFFCVAISVLLALLPNFVWFVGWIITRFSGHQWNYAPAGIVTMSIILIFWGIMAYGYFFGRWQFEVVPIEYYNSDIPEEFDGYRIVHISDFHLNSFDGHHEKLERLIDEINAQKPDLICFTGDLVTVGTEEAEPYSGTLKSLYGKDGVISVLGNHDFLIYSNRFSDNKSRKAAVDSLSIFEKESLGWHLLRNESIRINRGNQYITIIGVDNKNCAMQGFKTIDNGNLDAAISGTDGFRILLSHDPSHWESEVLSTNIHLTLSGHTHAAQVKIFGWALSRLMFHQSDGRFDQNGKTIYVNQGLGCTVPFRISAKSEITVITLTNKPTPSQ